MADFSIIEGEPGEYRGISPIEQFRLAQIGLDMASKREVVVINVNTSGTDFAPAVLLAYLHGADINIVRLQQAFEHLSKRLVETLDPWHQVFLKLKDFFDYDFKKLRKQTPADYQRGWTYPLVVRAMHKAQLRMECTQFARGPPR